MAQKKRKADPNSDPKTERPGVIRTGQFRRSHPRSGENSAASSSGQSQRDQASRNESYEEDDEEQSPRDRYMSIGEHLEELRKRIIWAVGVILAAALVGGYFSFTIHEYLVAPYLKTSANHKLILVNVWGPADVIFKLSILVGFVVAFPILLYIIWGFITPALSRRAAFLGNLAVAFSALLFWSGMAFAWFFVIPVSLKFMFTEFMPYGTIPQVSLENYYNFLFMLEFSAGLLFQMPLILVVLGAAGILTLEFHKRIWKHVIVGIFILGALATPPDVLSQVIFCVPLLILYFAAILILWVIEKGKRKRKARDEAREAEEYERALAATAAPRT